MFGIPRPQQLSPDSFDKTRRGEAEPGSPDEAESESFLPSSSRTTQHVGSVYTTLAKHALGIWQGIAALLTILLVLSLASHGQPHKFRYSYETGFDTDLGKSSQQRIVTREGRGKGTWHWLNAS
jgi:hypothetical protein